MMRCLAGGRILGIFFGVHSSVGVKQFWVDIMEWNGMMLRTSSVEATYICGLEWSVMEWSVHDLDSKVMTSI